MVKKILFGFTIGKFLQLEHNIFSFFCTKKKADHLTMLDCVMGGGCYRTQTEALK